MSRYIDADVLIDDLVRNRDFYPALVASAIRNTPTADVVEVVRCKDCKHYDRGICYCSSVKYVAHDKNHYCGYGERRETDVNIN